MPADTQNEFSKGLSVGQLADAIQFGSQIPLVTDDDVNNLVLRVAIRHDRVTGEYTDAPALEGKLLNSTVVLESGRVVHLEDIDGLPSSTGLVIHEFQRSIGQYPLSDEDPYGRIVFRQVATVTDDVGAFLGFASVENNRLKFGVDMRGALDSLGVVVSDRWKQDDLESYVQGLARPDDDARKILAGFEPQREMVRIPIELGFPLYSLFINGDEQAKEVIARASMHHDELTLVSLSFLDSPAQIPKLVDTIQKQEPEITELIDYAYSILGDIEELSSRTQLKGIDILPVRAYLFERVRSVIQSTASIADHEDFQWNLPHDSLKAIREIVYEFCGLDHPNIIQNLEVQEFGKLETLMLKHAGESAWHGVLKGYLDARWVAKLMEDTPGEMAKESSIFYATLGEALYEGRDESTGDTATQLSMTANAISQLIDKGILPKKYSVLDAGSGPMKFMSALLSLVEQKPESVLCVDRDPYTVPEGLTGVTFEQADLTDTSFIHAHHNEFDAVIEMWSPGNDNEAVLQKEFLDSIAHKLKPGGVAILEFPIDYVPEMLEEMTKSKRKTRGRISKEFKKRDGSKVKKSFEITTLMPLFDRLHDCNLKVLNRGSADDEIIMPLEYITSAGQQRGFLVVQKDGEPMSAIDQILYKGATAFGAFDARQPADVVRQ